MPGGRFDAGGELATGKPFRSSTEWVAFAGQPLAALQTGVAAAPPVRTSAAIAAAAAARSAGRRRSMQYLPWLVLPWRAPLQPPAPTVKWSAMCQTGDAGGRR